MSMRGYTKAEYWFIAIIVGVIAVVFVVCYAFAAAVLEFWVGVKQLLQEDKDAEEAKRRGSREG